MQKISYILICLLLLVSCSRGGGLQEADNIIIAHRGGASECGAPDNSIEALRYAISLGCYASECDFYITGDNNIIIAHADGDSILIGGRQPWTASLAEIRAAGMLANGEQYPSLDDYLDVLLSESRCTKLWMDIKWTQEAKGHPAPERAIAAVRRACEIVKERGAADYVDFICTSQPGVMDSAFVYASRVGCRVGWMKPAPPDTFVNRGYDWINMNLWHTDYVPRNDRQFDAYFDAGLEVSVYVVDREKEEEYVRPYADRLSGVTTDYPARLLGLGYYSKHK